MCKLSELETGKTLRIDAALLKSVEEKRSKNGKPYCVLTLSDGSQEIKCHFFEKRACDIKVPVRSVIACDLECGQYQDRKTYIIRSYGPVDMDPETFMKKAPGKPEKMLSYIRSQLADMPEDVRKVTEYILWTYEEELLKWPGAVTVHHSYNSGLLYHITRTLYCAIPVAKSYDANIGLVKAGIILHDIGKIREIEIAPDGSARFSAEGKMFGHVVLGLRMLDEAMIACGVNKNSENMQILANIICSHHLSAEHGAISKPATKEAYIVATLDNLDAKMDIFDETIDSIEPGSFSERKVYLDGINVYSPAGESEVNEPSKTVTKEEAEEAVKLFGDVS